MRYRETAFGFILALERGDELVRTLIAFARAREIDAAVINGIGSVAHVELGHFRMSGGVFDRRVFTEEMEASAICGNLALLDGEPFPHLHGVFSRRDFSTIGGHVLEAVTANGMELSIHTMAAPVVREHVEAGNLNPLNLEASS